MIKYILAITIFTLSINKIYSQEKIDSLYIRVNTGLFTKYIVEDSVNNNKIEFKYRDSQKMKYKLLVINEKTKVIKITLKYILLFKKNIYYLNINDIKTEYILLDKMNIHYLKRRYGII